MTNILQRSIEAPIREGLTFEERWKGPDRGLVFCWERGRELREREPEMAKFAESGELVPLWWEGGVYQKLKMKKKKGNLFYLATWQGLRNQDLNIDLDEIYELECSRFNQFVLFKGPPFN